MWRTRQYNMQERKAHQAACTPCAACGTLPFPHMPHWAGDVTGSMRGQYKLPKYLTKWKDPEDGFAPTTNASQPDERADVLLVSVAHWNCSGIFNKIQCLGPTPKIFTYWIRAVSELWEFRKLLDDLNMPPELRMVVLIQGKAGPCLRLVTHSS